MKKLTAIIMLAMIGSSMSSSGWASNKAAVPDPGTSRQTAGPDQSGWINEKTVIATQKKDYIYLVWDIFAAKPALGDKALEKPKTLLPYAVALALKYGFDRHEAVELVKIRVVSFNERDEYQGPRWDKMDDIGYYRIRKQTLKKLNLLEEKGIPQLSKKQVKILLQDNRE